MVLDSTIKLRNNMDNPRDTDICLAPKTIAVVLRQRKHNLHNAKRMSGERIFSLFKRANAGCTWNQALHQAIRKIVYVGSLRPHTVLVYGTSDHIEALRSAWIKNLLHAPDGFNILFFGDLPSLYIEPINHMNFTPLPDALCSIIFSMNRDNVAATVSSVKSQLQEVYKHVQAPSDQVVFEALNNLMREKKICLTDSGYFITSPTNRPLSVVVSAQAGLYAPLLFVSPAKCASPNERQQSPVRRNSSRRPKELNNKASKSSELKGHVTGIGDKLKDNNVWSDQIQQPQKVKLNKDKGATLRKLFGMKPKTKKRCKSGGSTGTQSGGSSSNHSPRNSPDEDGDASLLVNVLPYHIDSRTSSQLTSAAVPYPVSAVQRSHGNYTNESLEVHCGRTVVSSPVTQSDSEYEIEVACERADRVPEILPIKNPRRLRSIHGSMKRQIANPSMAWRRRHNPSTRSDDYALPTAEMYFQLRNHRRSVSHCSSTRNSTRTEGSARLEPNPPNVSKISVTQNELNAPNNSTITACSTRQHYNSQEVPEGRVSADGENRQIAHHSTPIDESASENKLPRVFDVTGHSHCAAHSNTVDSTPTKPVTSKPKRINVISSPVCGVCENKLKCACSCHETDSECVHNTHQLKFVNNQLLQEV